MKPKPILTILLALAISGGLLWAFPTMWMALVLVLLALLAGQAALIRRSMTHVRADQGAPALRVSRAGGAVTLAPAFANQNGSPAKPVLDPAAFARFRAHLESVEHGRGVKPQAAPAAASPAPASIAATPVASKQEVKASPSASALTGETSGVADRVALSGKPAVGAKRQPATPKVKSSSTYGPRQRFVMPGSPSVPAPKAAALPKAAPAAPPADDADGPDLFADLRPNREGTLPARATDPRPASLDELGTQILQAPDVEPHGDEAATLLKMAEEAVRRGDLGAGRASLGQHLSLLPPDKVTWQAHRLQVRVSALGNEPQAALDAFDAMTRAGFTLKPEAVPALIDEFVEGVPGDVGDSLRVSLLLKMLAVFRQAPDRPAMDQVYRLIIEAQERMGDERKLLQFLKNHLEIKKVMGEIPGQLELIDQIGNRLFKLGEVAEAREYYELGLKIRADQQQADLTRTSAKSGTTPQTA